MEEALYSQLGFFNTDIVRSDKEGDFLTSPEVSKYFGKIIRNWINSESNLKNIIEIGSGTGSLIEQIGIKEITAVELSSTARDELIKKGIKTYTTINELNTNTSDLIFGNEIDGVSQEVINKSDGLIEINQYGTKHSLNISVAVGIVIWKFYNLIKSNYELILIISNLSGNAKRSS